MNTLVKTTIVTLSVVGALFTALVTVIYLNERKERFGHI